MIYLNCNEYKLKKIRSIHESENPAKINQFARTSMDSLIFQSQQTGKNNGDQTYSCSRDWCLFRHHGGPIQGPIKRPAHHNTMGLKEGSKLGPQMMPRDSSLSESEWKFLQSGCERTISRNCNKNLNKIKLRKKIAIRLQTRFYLFKLQ